MQRLQALKLVVPFFLIAESALAGRPVYHQLTRRDLIERSNFIFTGVPSPYAPIKNCSSTMKNFYVQQVWKGDKSLQGKVIAVAEHNYKIFEDYKNRKLPSFEASMFRNGQIDQGQITSFLFTRQHPDGCFELSANGAQESMQKQREMEGLFAGADDCSRAYDGFIARVQTFSKDCNDHSDCEAMSISPNSCVKPFILNKKTRNELTNDEFLDLQSNARVKCMKEWSKEPACVLQVVPVRCHDHLCEAGKAEALSFKADAVKWVKGTMSGACAPHDAASTIYIINDGKNEYPLLSLNVWNRENHFVAEKDLYKEGVQASFCPMKGECRTIVKLNFSYRPIDASRGELSFKAETQNGEKISGTVPVVQSKKKESIICG